MDYWSCIEIKHVQEQISTENQEKYKSKMAELKAQHRDADLAAVWDAIPVSVDPRDTPEFREKSSHCTYVKKSGSLGLLIVAFIGTLFLWMISFILTGSFVKPAKITIH